MTVATRVEAIPAAADRSALRFLGAASRRIWILIAFAIVWELWFRANESLFVFPMSEILGQAADDWLANEPQQLFLSDLFYTHAIPSLARTFTGWGIAIVVGITAGLVLGVWRRVAEFFDPIIRFLMSVPSTALLPVAIVLFGITDGMNVFLVTFGTLWTILVNTIDGVRTVDRTMLSTARSLRMGRRKMFTHVLLPAASPQIFAGLRVSLGIALILMIVSELWAATEGIGFYIVFNQRQLNFDLMWSGIVLVGALGLVVNGVFSAVESRILHWNRAAGGGQ